jgi:tetratricopeptide (TPR) repeat protein
MLGATHPDTAISMGTLARLYISQTKYTEAEPLLQQAYTIFEQQLGAQHPHTATCLTDQALLYKMQSKYREAEQLCKRALMIYEQSLGPDHPTTHVARQNYVSAYAMRQNMKATKPSQDSPRSYQQHKVTRQEARKKIAKKSRKDNRHR